MVSVNGSEVQDVPVREVEVLHRRPHPQRWIIAAIVLILVSFVITSFANSQINWGVAGTYLFAPRVLEGLWLTIKISIAATLLGLMGGVIMAAMRLSRNPVASTVAWVYIWLFRSTPLYLQLLIWFNLSIVFGTVNLFGITEIPMVQVMTPMVAALLGLGLNESAYMAEIIRGGILSVDDGQSEAATASGFSRLHSLRYIVLPQSLPAIIPPLGNSTVSMLKMSSLAAAISYTELLSATQTIYFTNGYVIELLFVAAFWYAVLTSLTSVGQYFLERRFNRSRRALAGKPLLPGLKSLLGLRGGA